ncbi:MAG: GNAT family N-acetyltransferase [Bacillota bacterium]
MSAVKGYCLHYTVSEESFDSLAALFADQSRGLPRTAVFMSPPWLEAWWRFFNGGAALRLLAVRQAEKVVGLAPLQVRGDYAAFAGSPDVCDYMDCSVIRGAEKTFIRCLLGYLARNGVRQLDLHSLRPDAAALTGLAALAAEGAVRYSCTREAVSLELDLPATWEGYLERLNKKQRHEVRRKLRRLEEAAAYRYRVIEGAAAVARFTPQFLDLFKQNPDKARFLTGAMEPFFRAAIECAADQGWAKYGVLELGGGPAAVVLYFDYGDAIYLYNSAYDPAYAPLSAGLLCKILSIRDAINNQKLQYDFLKGGEAYKHRLGGSETPIYHCQVTLNAGDSIFNCPDP